MVHIHKGNFEKNMVKAITIKGYLHVQYDKSTYEERVFQLTVFKSNAKNNAVLENVCCIIIFWVGWFGFAFSAGIW